MSDRVALIIGAGPGGLTASYELLTRTDIKPIVFELSEDMGGISRTINYKGNRMDIGGHRFFSKSDRVMQWWLDKLPLEASATNASHEIAYQGQTRTISAEKFYADDSSGSAESEQVMLLRNRKSRIYFQRKFFDYPISLSLDTVTKLGMFRMGKIGMSFALSSVRQIKPEKNLEQFLINRFGRELYLTFFKSYTEKIWGVPCNEIASDWGAQRIKGLSVSTALVHAFKKMVAKASSAVGDVSQRSTETSLIERFLYPRLGPGQMWEVVAEKVTALGGQIHTNSKVTKIIASNDRIEGLEVTNQKTGEKQTYKGDFVFSTMPIRELVDAMTVDVPPPIKEISDGLMYRDFITVGLLVSDLRIKDDTPEGKKLVSDNWIYIQEPDVQIGRLQIFNNWSPYLVKDANTVWLGLEYFCNEEDPIWTSSDEDMVKLASSELDKIGIIDKSLVLDSTVIRVPKTYPAYFGTYNRFSELRAWLERFQNLWLIGRNGMHKYNNQDHSMLTAMTAVDNIQAGITDKENVWAVNAEMEYHESKSTKN